MPDTQLPDMARRLTVDRRTVVKGTAWSVPAIVVATATPVFAASGVADVIGIADNGSLRSGDEAGTTPNTSGSWWNVKFNVVLPANAFITGLTATVTCTGATTNGLNHKGGVTNSANPVGSRGAFVQSSGLYSNETSGALISSSGVDTGGTTSVPGYATWLYTFPDSLFAAGSARSQPIQMTFQGLGGSDTPIKVTFSSSGASHGIGGTSWTCAVAGSGALASA